MKSAVFSPSKLNRPWLFGFVLDACGLAGVALIGLGCWWIYPPAALLVVGSVLIGLAVILGRRAR